MKNRSKTKMTLADLSMVTTQPEPEKDLTTVEPINHPGDGSEGWVITATGYTEENIDEGTYRKIPLLGVVQTSSAKKLWDVNRGTHWFLKNVSALSPNYGVYASESCAVKALNNLDPAALATVHARSKYVYHAEPSNWGWMDRDRPW